MLCGSLVGWGIWGRIDAYIWIAESLCYPPETIITLLIKYVCVHAQSCLTLWNPMDCSLPGSSVHRVFQARILEWVAIFSSRGSSWPRDWTNVSCIFFIGRRILYHWEYSQVVPMVKNPLVNTGDTEMWVWFKKKKKVFVASDSKVIGHINLLIYIILHCILVRNIPYLIKEYI